MLNWLGPNSHARNVLPTTRIGNVGSRGFPLDYTTWNGIDPLYTKALETTMDYCVLSWLPMRRHP
jgi:hypothetical protein